jgi:hypothetical protein
MAPARRNDPKTRVIHSSTTTRENPSMIGIERRTNSFRPGSERTWMAKFPTNEPARTPHANPSIPTVFPSSRPPRMIPAL